MKTNYSDLLLHIPHASTSIPLEYFKLENPLAPGYLTLLRRSVNLVDLYTDELFVPRWHDCRLHPVIAHLCRTLCDMERLQDDPLEKRGLGILYGGTAARRNVYGITEQADELLLQEYEAYHLRAGALLCELDEPLLVDCHSFSQHSTQICSLTPEQSGIDICIGFNDDSTRPDDDTIREVIDFFMGRNYLVGVNVPFSNSKTFNTGEHP